MSEEIDDIVGVWYKPVKTENLDELYELLGNGCCAPSVHSDDCVILNKSCCGYRLSTLGGQKIDFTPGNDYWEYKWGNGFCTSVIAFNGNKIVQVQNGKWKIVTVREYIDDLMIMTVTIDGVEARVIYQKVDCGCCC